MATATATQQDLLATARRVFPGGTLGEFRLPEDVNMVFARGAGTRLWDVDGGEYVDFLLGSGPLIVGHSHPQVLAAMQEQLAQGTTFYTLNAPVIRLAERMLAAVPCAGQVRLAATGSEAMSYAVRMARAYTGRGKVLRFEGAWHGVSDTVLWGARPPQIGSYPRARPDSAGLTAASGADVLICPFNDAERASQLIAEHATDLAAVLVEPLQRCIRPRDGFLAALREATTAAGALLVFDEVVTGFRLAWGGAQEHYGVVADLAAYGKTISGGIPNAAVCGRTEMLDVANSWRPADDPQRTSVSGTMNGYPLAAAAGLATLELLAADGVYPRLHAMGQRIAGEIAGFGRELGIPLLVGGDGPVLQVLFTEEEQIVDYGTMLRADKQRAYRFGVELIRRGLFVSPYEKIYLSTVHSDSDIDRLLSTAREVLPLAAAG